ncbi:unnamed protein product, partial [Brenthis ino]
MAIFLCVFVCAWAAALGFNVDIPSRVVYTGNYQSMFGFTVQSHVDGDSKIGINGNCEGCGRRGRRGRSFIGNDIIVQEVHKCDF